MRVFILNQKKKVMEKCCRNSSVALYSCVFVVLFIFVMCFYFFLFQCLVHAMDTTPIVKTIQTNGKEFHLFLLVLEEKEAYKFPRT